MDDRNQNASNDAPLLWNSLDRVPVEAGRPQAALHQDPATSQEHTALGQRGDIPTWQRAIWLGSSVALVLVIIALCFIGMFALGKMMLLLESEDHDHLFQFAGMNLVTGGLLRLLAILIGGTIAFVGLAVSFFAHQKSTSLEASLAREELLNTKAALVTHSPGIIAIVIGAVVIISAVYARGTYNYRPAAVSNQAEVTGQDILPDALPALEDLLKETEKQHEPPPPLPPSAE